MENDRYKLELAGTIKKFDITKKDLGNRFQSIVTVFFEFSLGDNLFKDMNKISRLQKADEKFQINFNEVQVLGGVKNANTKDKIVEGNKEVFVMIKFVYPVEGANFNKLDKLQEISLLDEVALLVNTESLLLPLND